MPTALPPATDYTGASVTQGGKKTFMTAVRTYLSELLGTTGAKSAALAALGIESSSAVRNLALSAAVASSALTMAVKTRAGNDPSATDVVTVAMRASSAGGGDFAERQAVAALALTVPSGATLGHASGIAGWLYWYVIDNAGTLELAVSAQDFGHLGFISTNAINASSSSAYAMYSAAARSSVAFRRVARTRDTQTTAGTWTALPSLVELEPFGLLIQTGARGQCVLDLVAGNLVLSPYQGNVLSFPAADAYVPTDGVALGPSGLTPGSTYYIYAVASAGVVVSLEASATVPARDSQSGIMVKSADPTRVLVGMARPVTGPAWSNASNQRLVRSWFHDPGLGVTGNDGTASTSSTTLVEVGTAKRAEFLCWNNEPLAITYCGRFLIDTAGSAVLVSFGVDSTSVAYQYEMAYHAQNASGYQTSFSQTLTTRLAEGYHYVAPLFRQSGGGTATIPASQISVFGKGA